MKEDLWTTIIGNLCCYYLIEKPLTENGQNGSCLKSVEKLREIDKPMETYRTWKFKMFWRGRFSVLSETKNYSRLFDKTIVSNKSQKVCTFSESWSKAVKQSFFVHKIKNVNHELRLILVFNHSMYAVE